MSPTDFEVYAEDLERYDLQDIASACDRIGKVPRQEGELAFPDIGTLEAQVKRAEGIRCPPKSEAALEQERYEADYKANPEKYVDLRTDPEFQAVLARHGIKADALIGDKHE